MCRYCGINERKCGSQICSLGIWDDEEKAAIVDRHNSLRRKVAKGAEFLGSRGRQPAAADMKELVWDEEVAKLAQTWATQCSDHRRKPHDTNRNIIDGY